MVWRMQRSDRAGETAAGRHALHCAAGVALAAGATWLRFAVERTLQIDTGTSAYLASAFLVGLGLALAGLGASRLAVIAAEVRLVVLFRWAMLVQLAAFPALALTSRDIFSNVAYGVLQLGGVSPYLEGPRSAGDAALTALVSPRWMNVPTAYGPVVSMVSWGASAIGRALGTQVWGGTAAFKVVMLACVIATLFVARATLRAGRFDDAGARFALLAFTPLLAWEVSSQAHNDGLLVLELMVFVWAATQGRAGIAVTALAAGVFTKVAAAPLLVIYLALTARGSRVRAVTLASVAAGVGAVLVLPYWRGLVVLQGTRLAARGDVERHAHSLADLLALVLQPAAPRAAAVAYWACYAGSIVLCILLVLRAALRATTVARVLHEGIVVLLAWFVTAPWFQPWYATWLLPLAVCEEDPGLRRIVALYAVLTVVQWAVPLDPVTTVAVNLWVVVALWRNERAAGQRSSQEACGRTGAVPIT